MNFKLLLLLSFVLLFSNAPDAHAAFLIRTKTAATPASGIVMHNNKQKVSDVLHIAHAPLDRWAYRGWISDLSVITGVLGFFFPFFGFAALLLGFIGMSRRSRKRGVAVAGFVLGLAVVLLVIFAQYTGLPLY